MKFIQIFAILIIFVATVEAVSVLKKVVLGNKSKKTVAKNQAKAVSTVKTIAKAHSKALSQSKTKSKTVSSVMVKSRLMTKGEDKLDDEQQEHLEKMNREGEFLPWLVGDKSSEECIEVSGGEYIGCITFQKVYALFPDPKDTTDENDLNQFNEKFIYLYDHMMAVLSTKDATCENGEAHPSTYSFLKEIVYSQIQTPCNHHREICTVRQYEDQILKPREIEFSPDSRVASHMGSKVQDNCLILSPQMRSDDEELFYICADRLDQLNEIKWQLNRLLLKYPNEKHGKVQMLSEDHTAVTDVWFHIQDNRLWIDNTEPEIFNQPEEDIIDIEKPIVEWDCDDGNCLRPAYTLDEALEEFPMKDSDNEPKRCFAVPKVKSSSTFQKGSEKKTEIYYFCHVKNLDDSDSSPKQSALMTYDLVSSYNNLYIQASLIHARENIQSKDEKTQALGTAFFGASMFQFQHSFNEDCLTQGAAKDDCEKRTKKAAELWLTHNLCEDIEKCVSLVNAYEYPLGLIANNPDNPYLVEPRNIAYKDIIITVNTYRDLLDSKVKDEEGEGFEMPEPQILPGDLNEVKNQAWGLCQKGGEESLAMKMFYLPFFAEVDPWLEFFNVINQGGQQ